MLYVLYVFVDSAPFFSAFVVHYGHDCSCMYMYMPVYMYIYICLFDLCVTFTGEEEFQVHVR